MSRERKFDLLSLAALVAYLVQSIYYAMHQLSVLDEGAYLLKGYYFITRRYAPYQDYGPWTNHMPFSFLIPGIPQAWFGPGLAVGRGFAIFLGMLMMVAIFLTVRRWLGAGWTAFAVWAIAANPAGIKMYSVGTSQVIIACMLAWVLYFTLDGKRSERDLVIGGVLAGLMWVTRINMAPVIAFLVLYIWWQYGFKSAFRAGFAGGVVILGVYTAYYPEILKFSGHYPDFVRDLIPAFSLYAAGKDLEPTWFQGLDVETRLYSFFIGIRSHLLAMLSLLILLVVPWKAEKWQETKHLKSFVFLIATFAFLSYIHGDASLRGTYCVFCFQVYLSFFSQLGLLALAVGLVHLSEDNIAARVRLFWATSVAVFLISAVPFREWVGANLPSKWLRTILSWRVPTANSGPVKLNIILENKYAWGYQQSFDMLRHLIRMYLPLVTMALMLLLAFAVAYFLLRHRRRLTLQPAIFTLVALALLVSPTPLGAGGYKDYDCDQNVIRSYQVLGAELTSVLQPGDLIFWAGGESAVPLLYVPWVGLFPSQINDGYARVDGGDPETAGILGRWTNEMAVEWLSQAGYALLEADLDIQRYLADTEQWELAIKTSPADLCREDAEIFVFRHLHPTD